MKVQPYVSSEDGKIFDVSINTNEISFIILELTEEEIKEMVKDILEQTFLLKESCQEVLSGGSATVNRQAEGGSIPQKTRVMCSKQVDSRESAREPKLPKEIQDKLDKGLTVCLSCGYSGDDIQGENADLYEGYGCPKCMSKVSFLLSYGERRTENGGNKMRYGKDFTVSQWNGGHGRRKGWHLRKEVKKK